jgi:transcription elongation factor Elf1
MVEIRPKVTKRVRVTKTVKSALLADKCDGCGRLFQMRSMYNNHSTPGSMGGTFDGDAVDSSGHSMGNTFSCRVCSLECATTIKNGGWKKMKNYKPFIKAKRNLVRCSVIITDPVLYEAELIEEWEAT